MDRLAKAGRTFDVVLVDPPSSSTSGKRGRNRWLVERDLHALVERGARCAAPGGTLFVSTNLRRMRWDRFLQHVDEGLAAAGRSGRIETQTLPLDHRSGPGDLALPQGGLDLARPDRVMPTDPRPFVVPLCTDLGANFTKNGSTSCVQTAPTVVRWSRRSWPS